MADEDLNKNQELGKKSDDKKAGKGGLLKFILIPTILIAQAIFGYYFPNLFQAKPHAKP